MSAVPSLLSWLLPALLLVVGLLLSGGKGRGGGGEASPEFEFKLSEPDHATKYLALVGNKQQLGNQIWSLVSGYSIAKRLNRQFYVSQNWHDPELLAFKLADVHKIFPKFAEKYKIMGPAGEVLVPHNYWQGKMNITNYEDPLVHASRPEQLLVLDTPYAQNARYFSEYSKEIRDLLKFSTKIQSEGDLIVDQIKPTGRNDLVCAHIRRRDFAMYHWQSEFNASIGIIGEVLRREKHLSTLLMFGDDLDFMDSIINHLQSTGQVSRDSFSSRNSKGVDLYLASSVCSSVVMTSQSSSFAFWMAFLSRNQKSVYYLHDDFDPANPYKPRFDESFPLPWKSVRL